MRTAESIRQQQDEKYSVNTEDIVTSLTDACHEAAMKSATTQYIDVLSGNLLEKHVYDFATAYMVGKPSPFSHIIKKLYSLGYGIQIESGGHQGNGALKLTWVPNLNKYRYN